MMKHRDLLFQIAHDLKRLADAAETFLSVAAAEPEVEVPDLPCGHYTCEDGETMLFNGWRKVVCPNSVFVNDERYCEPYCAICHGSPLSWVRDFPAPVEDTEDQTFCDCGEPKAAEFARCANCERMMRKAEARSQSRTLEDLHNEENTPA